MSLTLIESFDITNSPQYHLHDPKTIFGLLYTIISLNKFKRQDRAF